MSKLESLKRKKAALKAKMDQERLDLNQTFQEIRQEMEPARLMKKALSGMLGFSAPQTENSGPKPDLPLPLQVLTDVLTKNSRLGFLLKLAVPLLLRYLPRLGAKTIPKASPVPVEPPANESNAAENRESLKLKAYGKLRQGISSLRRQINKKKKQGNTAAENESETP